MLVKIGAKFISLKTQKQLFVPFVNYLSNLQHKTSYWTKITTSQSLQQNCFRRNFKQIEIPKNTVRQLTLWQNLHWNGRSLECLTACCFRYQTELNNLPQSLQAHCWFFSSVILTLSTSVGQITTGGKVACSLCNIIRIF